MILNGSGPLRALHDRVRSPQARRRGVDSDQATAWLTPRLRSCCSVTSRGLGKPDNTSFARHKTHAKHSTGTCKVERTSSCVMPDATSPISATSNRAATVQRRVGRGGGGGGGGGRNATWPVSPLYTRDHDDERYAERGLGHANWAFASDCRTPRRGKPRVRRLQSRSRGRLSRFQRRDWRRNARAMANSAVLALGPPRAPLRSPLFTPGSTEKGC